MVPPGVWLFSGTLSFLGVFNLASGFAAVLALTSTAGDAVMHLRGLLGLLVGGVCLWLGVKMRMRQISRRGFLITLL